jgi:hypothetical protein
MMNTELEMEYKWGSNRPVIKTIMEHFTPKYLLIL